MHQLAREVLQHALAFSGLSGDLGRARVRRILYAEGLEGLLRGAPDELLWMVATCRPPEHLVLELFELLREPAVGADFGYPHASLSLLSRGLPCPRENAQI